MKDELYQSKILKLLSNPFELATRKNSPFHGHDHERFRLLNNVESFSTLIAEDLREKLGILSKTSNDFGSDLDNLQKIIEEFRSENYSNTK